ncbi:MAG: serine O-acetyltransferase [Pelagimonas sp.]|jgi:serine O-acetyltransferase|nr:serine O-acetyltransferase [Pelagimonas sp.]
MSLRLPEMPHGFPPPIPNWALLQKEAELLGGAEPVLQAPLRALFPENGALGQALALRLAETLQSDDLPKAALQRLFAEELEEAPDLESALCADLLATRRRDPACESYLHVFLNLKGFLALQAHRIAHHLWQQGRAALACYLSNRVSLKIGVDIHPAARIGTGVMLDHASGLVIGETAVVGDDVSILQNVTLGGTGKTGGDRHPKVQQGVMIGAGAKIIGNIQIGAKSKVAAGSVVLKDVPPNCTVAGIPAQIMRIHTTRPAPAETMDQSL